MKGNVASNYFVDREKDMRSFDCLPARVREALRNAWFDIAAPQVRSAYNRLGVNKTIAEIKRIYTTHAEKTRVETWGENYP